MKPKLILKTILLTVLCLLRSLSVVEAQGVATTLAQGLLRPWSISLDENNVYWVEDDDISGSVKKVSKNGGLVSILASGLAAPNAIAVDDSCVYWIEWNHGSNGSLKKISKQGGSISVLASDLNNAQHFLAQDNNNLYWSDTQTSGSGMIRKISKNGGTTTTLVNSGIYNLTPAIAVDNGLVYFYDGGNNINTVPVAGGNVSNIGQGAPVAFCIYGQKIYWVECSNGLIKKMPKTGGGVTVLSTVTYHPINLTVVGDYVYWIEFENPGRLFKVPVAGGAETIVSNHSNTMGIAADSTDIYWAENVYYNQGKIQKLSFTTTQVISKEFGNQNSLSVFSNPENKSFIISCDLKNTSTFHLSIYSVLGHIIYTKKTGNISGNYSKEIMLPNEKSGLYFIQIETDNGSFIKKLIIE